MKYIIAIDCGTTSTRVVLYCLATQKIVKSASRPTSLIYEGSNISFDALELYAKTLDALREVTLGLDLESVVSVGVTNQRESVVFFDAYTKKPLANGISWQCRRTSEMCDRLNAEGLAKTITKKTGLVVDPYFSATKIKWTIDNMPNVKAAKEQGRLRVGTVDTWLIYCLTGGKVFVTDYSNASRTMLLNIKTLEWDAELLEIFDVDKNMLPTLVSSNSFVGTTTDLGFPLKIAGILGDQQASLFGHACFRAGQAKSTYGTGCFILLNTEDKIVYSKTRMLTTIAYVLGGKPTYALEGAVFNATSIFDWLSSVGILSKAEDIDKHASQVENSGGVVFVPSFTGMGAPYWLGQAKAEIVGISRNTTRFHITHAAVESIAFSVKEIIMCMERDTKQNIVQLKIDGGGSNSVVLSRAQADILNCPVLVSKEADTTALGAVYISGLSSGVFKSLSDIENLTKYKATYVMRKDKIESAKKSFEHYKNMVAKTLKKY
ncbi:MAG: glycerol kinase GlpK [Firmicutes bacterium]|nr:glycerol kinase GlpK [Bacillota bacterium]